MLLGRYPESVFAYLIIGLVVVGMVAGAFLSSRWAGERGWAYNKHNPRPRGSGIPSASFGQAFKPELEYVVDELRSERVRADRDEAGDDSDET